MRRFQEIFEQKKRNPFDVKQILGEDRLTCVYQLPNESYSNIEAYADELASSREYLSNIINDTTNVTVPSNIVPFPLASKSINEELEKEKLRREREEFEKEKERLKREREELEKEKLRREKGRIWKGERKSEKRKGRNSEKKKKGAMKKWSNIKKN